MTLNPTAEPTATAEPTTETGPRTQIAWELAIRPSLLDIVVYIDALNVALNQGLVTTSEHRQLLALLSQIRNGAFLTTRGLADHLASNIRLSLEDRGFLHRYTDRESRRRGVALAIPRELATAFQRLWASANEEMRRVSESPPGPLDPLEHEGTVPSCGHALAS